MSSVTASPDLKARIALTRKKIADAAVQAGLLHDPYQHVLEALGDGLDRLAEATDRLDQDRQLMTPEERRAFLGQVSRQVAVAIGAHGPRFARIATWKTWAVIIGMQIVFALACVGGTLWAQEYQWPRPELICRPAGTGVFCGYWAAQSK